MARLVVPAVFAAALVVGAAMASPAAASSDHAHGTYRVGSVTGDDQLIVDPEYDVCYEVTAWQHSHTTTSNGTDALAHIYHDANCEDLYFTIQPNKAHQGSIHESVRFTPAP